MMDFLCYYHAAKGNSFWKPDNLNDEGYAGWVYAEWLAIFFKPLTRMSDDAAIAVWQTLSMIAYITTCIQLIGVPYGWILVLLSIKIVAVVLWTGNVSIILTWLCLTPIGTMVACLFKPWLIVVVALHFWHNELAAWLTAIAG